MLPIRPTLTWLAAVILLAATGCIQQEAKVTINPGGSGTIAITIAVSDNVAAMMESQNDNGTMLEQATAKAEEFPAEWNVKVEEYVGTDGYNGVTMSADFSGPEQLQEIFVRLVGASSDDAEGAGSYSDFKVAANESEWTISTTFELSSMNGGDMSGGGMGDPGWDDSNWDDGDTNWDDHTDDHGGMDDHADDHGGMDDDGMGSETGSDAAGMDSDNDGEEEADESAPMEAGDDHEHGHGEDDHMHEHGDDAHGDDMDDFGNEMGEGLGNAMGEMIGKGMKMSFVISMPSISEVRCERIGEDGTLSKSSIGKLNDDKNTATFEFPANLGEGSRRFKLTVVGSVAGMGIMPIIAIAAGAVLLLVIGIVLFRRR